MATPVNLLEDLTLVSNLVSTDSQREPSSYGAFVALFLVRGRRCCPDSETAASCARVHASGPRSASHGQTPAFLAAERGPRCLTHRLYGVVVSIKGNSVCGHVLRTKSRVHVQGCNNNDCYHKNKTVSEMAVTRAAVRRWFGVTVRLPSCITAQD